MTGVITTSEVTEGKPQSIKDVKEVQTYLTAYVDGGGKKQTRLCFRVPGSKQVFILNEQIQGKYVATTANSWFNSEFSKQVDVGKEGADQV